MNKQELIEKLMDKPKVQTSKIDMHRIVDGLIEEVTNALVNGDSVQIAGFGTFEVRERAARTARNPQNGETLSIPAKKVPAFKPGKTFKAKVNE